MKKLITQGISLLLVTALVITSISFSVTEAFASEHTSQTALLQPSEVNEYAGIDLSGKNFDEEKMDSSEKELYQLLLDREYEKNKELLDQQNVTKEEFLGEVKSYLQDNSFKYESMAVTTSSTRLISVSALGSALDVAISAVLIASGFGSIGEIVKKMGKNAAKKWIKKHLSQKVQGVLAKAGAKKLGTWIGGFLVSVVDVYLSPGTYIAKQLDSIDAIPNSGYIEV